MLLAGLSQRNLAKSYQGYLCSNMKKNSHKINDVIDNDVIILRPLSVVQKYTKQKT